MDELEDVLIDRIHEWVNDEFDWYDNIYRLDKDYYLKFEEEDDCGDDALFVKLVVETGDPRCGDMTEAEMEVACKDAGDEHIHVLVQCFVWDVLGIIEK